LNLIKLIPGVGILISKLFIPVFLALGIIFSFVFATNDADAASYNNLTKQGYKTGKLSRNPAGIRGWRLSKGADRYFCKMRVSLVYVGKSGMVGFSSSGRQIKMSRKAYESKTGGHDKRIPQMRDLKAGRLEPNHVGSCRKLRK